MPLVSRIGRQHVRIRLIFAAMYVLLIIGAASMIYPMLLMLSGSVKSSVDFTSVAPLPSYLWDDRVLWVKYLQSKYSTVPKVEHSLHQAVSRWEYLEIPELDKTASERAEQFAAFRTSGGLPLHWFMLGHLGYGQNGRAYRRLAEERFDGDIVAYSDAVGSRYKSWFQIDAPYAPFYARSFTFPKDINYELLNELKIQAAVADLAVMNLDGLFCFEYLRLRWPSIQAYDGAHGTRYADNGGFEQILLPQYPPLSGQARDDWEQFVRFDLNVAFIRLDPSLTPVFQMFLKEHYGSDLGELNRLWARSFSTFDDIILQPETPRSSTRAYADVADFIRDADLCPLDKMSVFGPRQGFEQYLAKQRGVPVEQIEHKQLPVREMDAIDFQQAKSELRWEFLKRNYIAVFDYVLFHGNGIRNTIIYCSLMILVTLTINPVAAYALSRFRPPSTYKVLLFCMCTMAFPVEVTMIPNFLLLKRFPIIGLGVAVIAGILAAGLLRWVAPRLSDWIKGVAAGAIGLASGFWLLPHLFGNASTSISLLNTFWALLLPGAANGFSIFLLKGFFDSLPEELYEAADIDGAGEITKFWTITMSLSKPILAVLALGAFTVAYSEFMMALVIIPDERMWTLMVWLFQLQSQAPPYIVYASLVIAALPTFAIFLFAQNIIMRGIVVPVEK